MAVDPESFSDLFKDLAREALRDPEGEDSLVGRDLGPYRVIRVVAVGGMGAVYLARDRKLQRDVAIKVLPDDFAADAQRVSLFEREARLLASLNHPNIATIHGLENFDGKTCLVLEFIEGKSLAELIGEDSLTQRQTLEICHQIAAALEAAHRTGVVHRDLKPANVIVRPDGRVKVLDFGVAKRILPVDAEEIVEDTTGPNTSGLVLGTPAYMSPEQIRGEPIDARTDVWAFGCVLFETLAGSRPFQGPSLADMLVAILNEPAPFEKMPGNTPDPIFLLISRCLQKEARERLHAIADARIVIGEVLSDPALSPASGTFANYQRLQGKRRDYRRVWKSLAVAIVGVLVGAAIFQLWSGQPDVSAPAAGDVSVMQIPGGHNATLGYGSSVAISRNGENVAYVAQDITSTVLYFKAAAQQQFTPLPGTEGAVSPFFSPDGRWLGFFDRDDRMLKRLPLNGAGPALEITGRAAPYGAAWGIDDRIYFAAEAGGLASVALDGGDYRQITEAEPEQHTWPSLIEDHGLLLFTERDVRGSYDNASVALVDLAGAREHRVIQERAYFPHFMAPNYLIYVQNNAVLAAPFDVASGRVDEPVDVTFEGGVWKSSWIGYADFAFSATGTLVNIQGGSNPDRAVVTAVDRRGELIATIAGERRPYRVPRLSPDGKQLALVDAGGDIDIWLWPDLFAANPRPLTRDRAWDAYPVWDPLARTIAFSTQRGDATEIYSLSLADDEITKLVSGDGDYYPSSFSPDGNHLAYWVERPDSGGDLWVADRAAGTEELFLGTPHNESRPVFSPDGGMIAYVSDEQADPRDVYVRPYPAGNPPLKVSVNGGMTPRWSADGSGIYYIVDGQVWLANIEYQPTVRVAGRTRLFFGPYGDSYDVSPDGETFIMLLLTLPGDPQIGLGFDRAWSRRVAQRVASLR